MTIVKTKVLIKDGGSKMKDVSKINTEYDCAIDYEKEYARLYEENTELKIENKTLKEAIIKLAVRI